jgi:parallel beta-helix repeat protein
MIAEAAPEGCRRIVVRENLARNNGGPGIEVAQARDATVQDNNSRDNRPRE